MKKKMLSVITLAAVAVAAVVLAKLPILPKDKSEVITLQNYAVPAGEVAIDEKNFPGMNFRKFVTQYDKDNSGGLSQSELKSVTEINCSTQSIGNMKGIEYFTELKELNCKSNGLYTLDLSKNTSLIELNCEFNYLKELNLENNTSLKTLYISGNMMTSMDFSKNTSLETLECYYCQNMTSLDVQYCTKLRTLSCGFNSFATLDLSKNTMLTYLGCAYSTITSLDVSNCKDLYALVCKYCKLSSLDVTGNPKLMWLTCEGNEMSELDIHLCPILLNLVKKETKKEEILSNGNYYYYGEQVPNPDSFLSYDTNVNLITGPSVGKVTGLKAVSAGRNKVKLSWNAVEGAEGYLVYAQKDKKYAYVGMTTKGTIFTDTKALDSDYNYYWVFAYVKDIDGSLVPGGCEKYVYAKGVCLAVTNLKATSQTGSVKLSWTASAGSEGYLIYGIRPGGSYGYIGMTTKGTTYTDTKASKTDYTFYWVFPYHKDADGTMIVGGTAKYTYGKVR